MLEHIQGTFGLFFKRFACGVVACKFTLRVCVLFGPFCAAFKKLGDIAPDRLRM